MTSSPPSTTAATKLATRLVLFCVLATGIGQSMTFTLLAPLGREVGLKEVQVGLIISCSSLVFTLTSPIWGRASDRWGRKPVLQMGLFGYGFGCLLFATVFYYGLEGLLTGMALFVCAITSRVLMALLMPATPSAASAYIADTTNADQRLVGMGRLGAARTLGAILGPAMCGLLGGITLLTPLYIAAGVTLFSAVLIALVLREPARIKPDNSKGPKLRLFDQRYLPYLLVGFSTFFAFSLTSQTIGFFIQDRFVLDGRGTAQALGMTMMVAAAMSFFSQAYLVNRLNLKPVRLIILALPVLLVGYVAILFASNMVVLTIVLGIIGLGLGMVSPGFTAGASLSVGPDEQGAIGGLVSACPGAGFILGPIVGTSLYQSHHRLPYLIAGIVMLLLMIYVWRFSRRERGKV